MRKLANCNTDYTDISHETKLRFPYTFVSTCSRSQSTASNEMTSQFNMAAAVVALPPFGRVSWMVTMAARLIIIVVQWPRRRSPFGGRYSPRHANSVRVRLSVRSNYNWSAYRFHVPSRINCQPPPTGSRQFGEARRKATPRHVISRTVWISRRLNPLQQT